MGSPEVIAVMLTSASTAPLATYAKFLHTYHQVLLKLKPLAFLIASYIDISRTGSDCCSYASDMRDEYITVH